MAKKPKITVTSDRTVTVTFGPQPTFAQLEGIAHRHGLSDYAVQVYDLGAPTIYSFTTDWKPAWTAKFTKRESLDG